MVAAREHLIDLWIYHSDSRSPLNKLSELDVRIDSVKLDMTTVIKIWLTLFVYYIKRDLEDFIFLEIERTQESKGELTLQMTSTSVHKTFPHILDNVTDEGLDIFGLLHKFNTVNSWDPMKHMVEH